MTAEQFFAEWVRALDDLERSALLPPMDETDEAFPDWNPPMHLGPIPPQLVDRARFILAAQQDAIVRVSAARERTGRHLRLVTATDVAPEPAARVLDIAG